MTQPILSGELERSVGLKSGEDFGNILRGHVPGENLGEHVAEVGRKREVAAFVKLFGSEAGPAAVNFSAFDGTAEGKHAAGVAVIGAAGAILANGPAEFGHGQDNNITHAVTEIAIQRREAVSEFPETR